MTLRHLSVTSGGGGGTPGGSSTQVQYNNAGAFGGSSGIILNSTQAQLFSPQLFGGILGPSNNTTVATFDDGSGPSADHIAFGANTGSLSIQTAGSSTNSDLLIAQKGNGGLQLGNQTSGSTITMLLSSSASIAFLPSGATNTNLQFDTGGGTYTLPPSGGATNIVCIGATQTVTNKTIGDKLRVSTGTNKSIGTATLSSGTITVSTTVVSASSKIFVQYAAGTALSIGIGNISTQFYVPTITAGTSFVINGLTVTGTTNVTDNSTVMWWIIN